MPIFALALAASLAVQAPATDADRKGAHSPAARYHAPDEANKKFAALHQQKAAPVKHKHQMHQSPTQK